MTTIIRRMGIGLVCLFTVSLWSTAAGAVSEADVTGYPLLQAWRDTLERDARLQAAAGRIAQARGRVGEVASERWPSVSATGQLGHVYNRNEACRAVVYEGRSLRGTLYLSQPLYTFGRLTGRTVRAEADLAEAEAAAVATARWELEADQERVETEARAQWEMIASLALAVQDFGQAVKEALQAAALTRAKVAVGQATVVDKVDARHAVLRAEHDVLDGRLRLAGVRIDLLRLLAALDRDG